MSETKVVKINPRKEEEPQDLFEHFVEEQQRQGRSIESLFAMVRNNGSHHGFLLKELEDQMFDLKKSTGSLTMHILDKGRREKQLVKAIKGVESALFFISISISAFLIFVVLKWREILEALSNF